MLKLLKWLDNNILALLAGFLLIFIPLYPKWPLFDILYGYNVRVRLEDLFVLATCIIFVVQLLRRKVKLSLNLPSIGLITYLFIGLISSLFAIYILGTVPNEYLHVAKTMLHWVRRIEYFSLFFIFFSTVNSMRRIKVFMLVFFFSLALITLYGYGQKYLYWPAFSTMNREFAKGWWLYLTEHARVLSTFGGHYDLAAYLVIALTLGWSFFFGLKNKLQKLLVGLAIAGGFWLLILTASRISFISYLIGLAVVCFLWMFRWGLEWGLSRFAVASFLSILVMLSFGDLSDRFMRILRLEDRFSGVRQLLLNPSVKPPQNKALFLNNSAGDIGAVTSKSDQPPTPIRPGDVTGNEEPLLIPQKQPDGTIKLVEKPRSYSQCALRFDLSTCIRLEVTWPRAFEAFKFSPLLGTGYATLTKARIQDFTEAESTDSDYFRAIGETGALGFIAFFGTLALMGWLAFRSLGGIKDPFLYSLTAGFIAFLVGLLANAAYIDIFEASKVAYVFWGLSGLTMGSLFLYRQKIKEDREPLRINFAWHQHLDSLRILFLSDKFWVTIFCIAALMLRFYKIDTPLADWHSWRQADTSAVTRNYIHDSKIDLFTPRFDDLSSIPSGLPNPQGLRYVEFPIYNATAALIQKLTPEYTEVVIGRATTAFSSVFSGLFIFLILRKLISRRAAYLSLITFSILPYSIFYGRTILPDPTMVMYSLGAIFFSVKYILEQKWKFLVLLTLFAALALLVKPFAIFLLSPIIYLWVAGFGLNKKKLTALVISVVLALLPLILWRLWISQFPQGIPASDWLFNGDGIRFKGAFWYWLFADRIGREILGYWGLILLGFGLVRKLDTKFKYFPLFLLLSSCFYLVVFATGNVRHDYYQILLIPSLSILVGLGLDFLLFNNHLSTKFLAVVSLIFMLAFSWYFIKDLYNINHPEIVEAGQEIQKITHDKSLVIAPYDGDTAFLYQTNRRGWPIIEGTIDHMIDLGAHYYVSVRFDAFTNELLDRSESYEEARRIDKKGLWKKYNLLKKTDKYVILQLVPDKDLPK